VPELPEVETIRRRLAERIVGKTIQSVEIHREKSFQGNGLLITNQTIQAVSRRAKILQLRFSDNLLLLVHLKMTGQLILLQADGNRVGGGHPTADWVENLPAKHTRVTIQFTDGDRLFFNDQRVFGWLKVADATQAAAEFAQYGPDINDPSFTANEFVKKLSKTRVPTKLAILNSALVAGIGNIYACDALNLAQISPFKPANTLTETEAVRLFSACQTVIQRGIELQGTTFDGKYVDVAGFAGGYQNEALAYGRAGQPCKNCGELIKKTQQAGRGTYFCPHCQH
jgi:formamidopyrimidine-DNA glycosylase